MVRLPKIDAHTKRNALEAANDFYEVHVRPFMSKAMGQIGLDDGAVNEEFERAVLGNLLLWQTMKHVEFVPERRD